jgi:hypothetical protein
VRHVRRLVHLVVALLAASVLAAAARAASATTTTVAASPARVVSTGSITWTIHVDPVPPAVGPVTGAGTWVLSGPNGTLASNSFAPSPSGTSITATGLMPAVYTVVATFAANGTWAGSSGQATGAFAYGTTTTLVASAAAGALAGDPVTLTATVAATGATPTGSAVFLEGTRILGTVPLSGGSAALTTDALGAGSHAITAVFPGHGLFDPSVSLLAAVTLATPRPPLTTAAVVPAPNAAGWVRRPASVTLHATPASGGTAVVATLFAIDRTSCTPLTPVSCTPYGGAFTVSAFGRHALTFFSRAADGSREAARTLRIGVDGAAPRVAIAPAAGRRAAGLRLVAARATAVFATRGGRVVGTVRATCFDSLGVLLRLSAVDQPRGSGVAGFRYAVRGAARPSAGHRRAVLVRHAGVTRLTATARDAAGNVRRAGAAALVFAVGATPVGCGAVTTSLALPSHGSVTLRGRLAVPGDPVGLRRRLSF